MLKLKQNFKELRANIEVFFEDQHVDTRRYVAGRVYHTCIQTFPDEAWNPRATRMSLTWRKEVKPHGREQQISSQQTMSVSIQEPAEMCQTH